MLTIAQNRFGKHFPAEKQALCRKKAHRTANRGPRRLSIIGSSEIWKTERERRKIPKKTYPRWTRADTLSSGKKSALDIVIVLGGRQPRPKGTGLGRPGGRCQAAPPSSSSSPAPIFARRKVLRSFSGAEIVTGEADEAGGLTPGNEENEAGRGFRPEKPYLPLSIEGTLGEGSKLLHSTRESRF